MTKKEIEPINKTKDERQYWLIKNLIPDTPNYPAHLKFATIMKYAMCGSIRETERATGVPRATLRSWMHSDWWAEAYRRAEEFQSARISAKMTRLVNASVDRLQDKIENGEIIIIRDKHGAEIARENRPLAAKTLLDIAKTAAAHSSMSREVRKQEAPQAPNMNSRLLSLAEDCVKVQQAMAGINAKPIEGAYTNVESGQHAIIPEPSEPAEDNEDDTTDNTD